MLFRSYQNKTTEVLAFEDMFFPHGTRSEIFKGAGVSAEHIAQAAELLFTETNTVSGSAALHINDLPLRGYEENI